MVLDEKTNEPLHELSDFGWDIWASMKLRVEAYKAKHPILYLVKKIFGIEI